MATEQKTPSKTIIGDRFIPSRTSSNFHLFHIPNSKENETETSHNSTVYRNLLKKALFGPECGSIASSTDESLRARKSLILDSPNNSNIFKFKTVLHKRGFEALTPFGDEDQLSGEFRSPAKAARKFEKSPWKVLDAPGLEDDYYVNLVDWSSENVLAVGLRNSVYALNDTTGKVIKLCDLGDADTVCSVGWAHHGTQLAVGTYNGKVQLWDASRCKKIRTMKGHQLRAGALAWSSSMLSSGSRDKTILHRDVRAPGDYVSRLTGHTAEVCGLKWSYDDNQLASGGNDNHLLIWNRNSTQHVLKYCEHVAAVKAIAWSPHLHGLLASGGGTADGCIRFWNTNSNSQLSCVDTGSQVCNLVWSKNVNEIVSTHGFAGNQINVWKYPTMSKLATMTGHSQRVLYLAVSPDGQTIVTGAGDETLRFWNIFPSLKPQNTRSEIGAFSLGRTYIR